MFVAVAVLALIVGEPVEVVCDGCEDGVECWAVPAMICRICSPLECWGVVATPRDWLTELETVGEPSVGERDEESGDEHDRCDGFHS